MEPRHDPHPWVADGRGRIRFGVTQATWETSPDWDTRVAFVPHPVMGKTPGAVKLLIHRGVTRVRTEVGRPLA